MSSVSVCYYQHEQFFFLRSGKGHLLPLTVNSPNEGEPAKEASAKFSKIEANAAGLIPES